MTEQFAEVNTTGGLPQKLVVIGIDSTSPAILPSGDTPKIGHLYTAADFATATVWAKVAVDAAPILTNVYGVVVEEFSAALPSNTKHFVVIGGQFVQGAVFPGWAASPISAMKEALLHQGITFQVAR